MPIWEIDFSDIDSDTEIPEGVGEEDELPEGYGPEYEAIDVFVTENLQRAKESKDADMVKFVVDQAIARYSRLGLKQAVLDKEIWITQQLGKGILKNFQTKQRGAELQTQLQYMQELISGQKQTDMELRGRIANLRAERDFKKAKLEAVFRQNHGMMSEVDHIKKRIALTQERIRLDTIEYDREKELRDDLQKTFVEYTEDLDRQLVNAPWLVEKQKHAARRKELEDEVAGLEADLAKIDLLEKRNQEIEDSERELPFKQFCVQLAELYLKKEKMAMQLEVEKAKVKKLEEERRQRRALEDSSQLDCTQAMLDADLDDEETLMKMAKHYKLDTQNVRLPVTQMTQDSQLPPASQVASRKRAQSPAESTASSEANDMDMSDGGEQLQSATTTTSPPAAKKRVSIVLPTHNPDESVDEAMAVQMMREKEGANESQMEEEEQNGDRSQPEQMETDEREEEEEEEEEGREEGEKEGEEEEEHIEQPESEQVGSQESETGSVAGVQMEQEEQEEEEEHEDVDEDGFVRPAERSMMMAAPSQPMEEMEENAEAETSFNPEMMLNLSANSNDPGNDFFDMMNDQATRKRAAADAVGGSPAAGGGDGGDDGGFLNMFGGGDAGGDAGAGDGDAASFSFNFGGGGDANDTNGGGGGEFNFFGF